MEDQPHEIDCDPGDETPMPVSDPPTPSDQGDGSGQTTEEDEPSPDYDEEAA